jgi:hypothetical protein
MDCLAKNCDGVFADHQLIRGRPGFPVTGVVFSLFDFWLIWHLFAPDDYYREIITRHQVGRI